MASETGGRLVEGGILVGQRGAEGGAIEGRRDVVMVGLGVEEGEGALGAAAPAVGGVMAIDGEGGDQPMMGAGGFGLNGGLDGGGEGPAVGEEDGGGHGGLVSLGHRESAGRGLASARNAGL